MGDQRLHTPQRGALRATLSGDGRPGPIEERIGRRLVRVLDPESEEGRHLLDARQVDLVGPGGERLGRIALAEALRKLEEKLLRLMAESDSDRDTLDAGLERLRAMSRRIGRS